MSPESLGAADFANEARYLELYERGNLYWWSMKRKHSQEAKLESDLWGERTEPRGERG